MAFTSRLHAWCQLTLLLVVPVKASDNNDVSVQEAVDDLSAMCADKSNSEKCTMFAMDSLSVCGSDDMSCTCSQLVAISDHCTTLCSIGSRPASLSNFLDVKCKNFNASASELVEVAGLIDKIRSRIDSDDDDDDCDNGDDSDDGLDWYISSVDRRLTEPSVRQRLEDHLRPILSRLRDSVSTDKEDSDLEANKDKETPSQSDSSSEEDIKDVDVETGKKDMDSANSTANETQVLKTNETASASTTHQVELTTSVLVSSTATETTTSASSTSEAEHESNSLRKRDTNVRRFECCDGRPIDSQMLNRALVGTDLENVIDMSQMPEKFDKISIIIESPEPAQSQEAIGSINHSNLPSGGPLDAATGKRRLTMYSEYSETTEYNTAAGGLDIATSDASELESSLSLAKNDSGTSASDVLDISSNSEANASGAQTATANRTTVRVIEIIEEVDDETVPNKVEQTESLIKNLMKDNGEINSEEGQVNTDDTDSLQDEEEEEDHCPNGSAEWDESTQSYRLRDPETGEFIDYPQDDDEEEEQEEAAEEETSSETQSNPPATPVSYSLNATTSEQPQATPKTEDELVQEMVLAVVGSAEYVELQGQGEDRNGSVFSTSYGTQTNATRTTSLRSSADPTEISRQGRGRLLRNINVTLGGHVYSFGSFAANATNSSLPSQTQPTSGSAALVVPLWTLMALMSSLFIIFLT